MAKAIAVKSGLISQSAAALPFGASASKSIDQISRRNSTSSRRPGGGVGDLKIGALSSSDIRFL